MAVQNLTDEAALREAAKAWIASNGLPSLNLVQDAIAHSNAAGDPFSDNPFRRALVAEATARGASD